MSAFPTATYRLTTCTDDPVSPTDLNPSHPIHQLPGELLQRIFFFMSTKELGVVRRVCWKWNDLASEYNFLSLADCFKHHHPELPVKVYDTSIWTKEINLAPFGLPPMKLPIINKRALCEITKKRLNSISIKGNAGGSWLPLPEGLTLNIFIEAVKTLNNNGESLFKHVQQSAIDRLGDDPIKKMHMVFLSNDVITNSQCRPSIEESVAFAEMQGCKLPTILAISTLALITRLKSQDIINPIRLFGNNTLSRCCDTEIASGIKWHYSVGYHSKNGLQILPMMEMYNELHVGLAAFWD